jgi:hypothetical protein
LTDVPLRELTKFEQRSALAIAVCLREQVMIGVEQSRPRLGRGIDQPGTVCARQLKSMVRHGSLDKSKPGGPII